MSGYKFTNEKDRERFMKMKQLEHYIWKGEQYLRGPAIGRFSPIRIPWRILISVSKGVVYLQKKAFKW